MKRDNDNSQSRNHRGIVGFVAYLTLLMSLALIGCQESPSSPRYIVEGPFGGVQAERGSAEEPSLVFVPTSLVRFEIRPEKKAERGAYSTMYVEGPSGKLKRAPLDAVVPTESGGFSIEAEGNALFLEGTGTYQLHILISDRPDFPEEPTASGLLGISGLQPVVSVPVAFKERLAAAGS